MVGIGVLCYEDENSASHQDYIRNIKSVQQKIIELFGPKAMDIYDITSKKNVA